MAIHRRAVEENSLVFGNLFGATAHVDCRCMLRLGTLVDTALSNEVYDVANGRVDRARRPDILAGVDMAAAGRKGCLAGIGSQFQRH